MMKNNSFLLHGHSFLHFGKLHYCAQTSTPLYGFSLFCVVDVFKIYLPNNELIEGIQYFPLFYFLKPLSSLQRLRLFYDEQCSQMFIFLPGFSSLEQNVYGIVCGETFGQVELAFLLLSDK